MVARMVANKQLNLRLAQIWMLMAILALTMVVSGCALNRPEGGAPPKVERWRDRAAKPATQPQPRRYQRAYNAKAANPKPAKSKVAKYKATQSETYKTSKTSKQSSMTPAEFARTKFAPSTTNTSNLKGTFPAVATASPAVKKLLKDARYLKNKGKLESAVRAAERALRVEPRSAAAYQMLAEIRFEQKRFFDAHQLARKALAYVSSQVPRSGDLRDRSIWVIKHSETKIR